MTQSRLNQFEITGNRNHIVLSKWDGSIYYLCIEKIAANQSEMFFYYGVKHDKVEVDETGRLMVKGVDVV